MDNKRLKSLFISTCTTIKESMQKLNETAEKILFIVDNEEKLLGTLSDGDIRRGLMHGINFTDPIEGVMRRDYIALPSGLLDLEQQARQLMIKNKIEQIPILDLDSKVVDVALWTDIFGEKDEKKKQSLYSNQVVVMAGGRGTRLDPFTAILPKPLIPIGNKSVIEIIMEKFLRCGFHRFIYTLNYKREYIKLFLKERAFPYEISWVEEDDFLGTIGGLTLLQEQIEDTFFVANCDSVLELDFDNVLAWHKENGAAITIIGCHNEVKIPFGVLTLSNGRLENILEKPVHDVIINTGVYILEPRVLTYLTPGVRTDMNELIQTVAAKERVCVYPIYKGWFDIGQWDEYKKNVQIIEKGS
jgi:dTDP-glucose pyrophosphorylase